MATAVETTPVPAHDGIVVGEPPIVDITARLLGAALNPNQ